MSVNLVDAPEKQAVFRHEPLLYFKSLNLSRIVRVASAAIAVATPIPASIGLLSLFFNGPLSPTDKMVILCFIASVIGVLYLSPLFMTSNLNFTSCGAVSKSLGRRQIYPKACITRIEIFSIDNTNVIYVLLANGRRLAPVFTSSDQLSIVRTMTQLGYSDILVVTQTIPIHVFVPHHC